MCASTQTSYSWVAPVMSTDQMILPSSFSLWTWVTVPPPTAIRASCSACCFEIRVAALASTDPISRTTRAKRERSFHLHFSWEFELESQIEADSRPR